MRESFKKVEGGPVELNNRMRRMIDLMVHGHEEDPSKTPYTIEDAAKSVGYQRRAGRALMQAPLFRAEFERQLDALRRGEGARCVRTMIAIRDETGGGKAADRKVRLDAAKAIMGEEAAKGPAVNVTVNNAVQQVAGYVIRVPARQPDPPPTIDGRPNRSSDGGA
jgi:hypothetical protein